MPIACRRVDVVMCGGVNLELSESGNHFLLGGYHLQATACRWVTQPVHDGQALRQLTAKERVALAADGLVRHACEIAGVVVAGVFSEFLATR